MSHMYGIEALSFKHVVPDLDVESPVCFFAGEEPLAGDAMIVMEDLTTRNVTFNSALRPLHYGEVQQHLGSMARYHANWWGNPDLRAGGGLDFIDEIVADASRARLGRESDPEVWGAYLQMPRAAALPARITDPNRLFPALQRLWDLNRMSPYCLIHNDCHIGNTYVCPDGEVGFLDWAVKRAPWYKDFAYFLVTAVDVANRREWECALLSHYLKCLDRLGVEAPSFEEAWFCYRCELLYSLTVWTCNGDADGQFQNEAVNTACAVRAGMAVLDHASIDLIG